MTDGKPAVVLEVRRQAGANTVEVINNVKTRLARIRQVLPPGVILEVVQDQSRYIESAFHEVQLHLILGSILASLVVSLTVTPVLSSWLLPNATFMDHDRDGLLLRVLKGLAGLAIRFSVRHPLPILGAVALAVVASIASTPTARAMTGQCGLPGLANLGDGLIEAAGLIALGRSIDRKRATGSPFADLLARLQIADDLPGSTRPYIFQRMTSCSISLSRDRSATIFFNLPFSEYTGEYSASKASFSLVIIFNCTGFFNFRKSIYLCKNFILFTSL